MDRNSIIKKMDKYIERRSEHYQELLGKLMKTCERTDLTVNQLRIAIIEICQESATRAYRIVSEFTEDLNSEENTK